MLCERIDKQLGAGVAEPAQSKWGSPIWLVLKNDGTFRFYVDFQRLNTGAIPYIYPVPRRDDGIYSLKEDNV